MTRTRRRALAASAPAAAAAAALLLAGCPQKIGGRCEDSLDCSSENSRLCDVSQPDGYCLIPDCAIGGFVCPREALCASFRDTSESYCLRACERDEQCRPGYVCCVPEASAGIDIVPLPDGGMPAGGRPGYCIAADSETGDRPAGCTP